MLRRNIAQGVRTFSASAHKRDVARFTAVGTIGNDLEKQVSGSGTEYLKYPLAVSGRNDTTSWFNIVVFDPRAIEFMTKYLKKGARVFVEADASQHSYTTEDGSSRRTLQLVQQNLSPIYFGKKAEATSSEEQA